MKTGRDKIDSLSFQTNLSHMKKILLLFALAILFINGQAQIKHGVFYGSVSSNLNFVNHTFSNNAGYQEFNFGIRGGYFLVRNLMAGPDISYSRVGTSDAESFGFFGRYYFWGKLFAGGGMSEVGSATSKSVTEFPFEAGYIFFLSEAAGIEPRLIYTYGNGYEKIGFQISFALYFNR
ncbi:hypothetical protein WSM22_07900 [Cytophagales bacterium WSM2-2]|nr:hypothetical protein WSM22_07900 [Cytophagales bacterium WSM2-2]